MSLQPLIVKLAMVQIIERFLDQIVPAILATTMMELTMPVSHVIISALLAQLVQYAQHVPQVLLELGLQLAHVNQDTMIITSLYVQSVLTHVQLVLHQLQIVKHALQVLKEQNLRILVPVMLVFMMMVHQQFAKHANINALHVPLEPHALDAWLVQKEPIRDLIPIVIVTMVSTIRVPLIQYVAHVITSALLA